MRFLALVVLALASLPAQASAADIIVRRDAGLDRSERADIRRDAGVKLVDTLTLPDTEVVRAGDPRAALAALNADPDVHYAELDGQVHLFSDDALFTQQWALQNTGQFGGLAGADMDVPDAWTRSTGAGVTVAVVDTGVDADVTDLAGQIDARGWDFIGDDDDPADENGHGTHVTGTIAALAGNGVGVAGVAPGAHVLPVRALDAAGDGTDSTIAEAFDYAGDAGARIVNASLGGAGTSRLIDDAIAAHPDTLYVVAAGNSHADDDAAPVFPCTSALANVLCVGASDNRDARAWFSNYGATTVDVFAPGTLIDSTLMGGGYGFLDGTSMASPQVAGIAALALAADPAATTGELKAAVLASADARPGLTGLAVTGGRVNAAAAVEEIGRVPEPTPTPTPQATPTPTPTPEPPAPTPTPVPRTDPPAPTPTPVAAAQVSALKLSGRLRGGSGRLQATFTVTRGAPVRITIAGGPTWSLTARAGANTLRIARRVRGRTLKRGRHTLTVAAPGSAKSAPFSVR
ncbi:S8 family serine peptidase [Candidatus Solirubrobacter pratensis]|uniref:S8 family serine peptidase n=1 Tax=Candidatus Solirubrobacter pratensis TaxID=1298857 RepID=UPI0004249879|nr:S8 family serine peptidase [Candidatus Solirubrobacter pratensis]